MAFNLYDAWYFVMGLLLANGVPHFTFGAAGKVFRSPFGRRSSPLVNIRWGVANFAVATAIGVTIGTLGLHDGYSLAALLLGFWLMVLYFGLAIKRFLNE